MGILESSELKKRAQSLFDGELEVATLYGAWKHAHSEMVAHSLKLST